jgi:hypothetical protein
MWDTFLPGLECRLLSARPPSRGTPFSLTADQTTRWLVPGWPLRGHRLKGRTTKQLAVPGCLIASRANIGPPKLSS